MESFPVKQNAMIPEISSQSPPPPISCATPHHQPPLFSATAPALCVAPPHERVFSCGHRPLNTTLSLATPHQPPSSAATAPLVPTSQPTPTSPTTVSTLFNHLHNPDYKSSLYIFVQKTKNSFPKYQTVSEGPRHAPRYRSTVWVGNRCFTSQTTFSQRKTAEQDVSRVALEGLHAEYAEQDFSLLVLKNAPNYKGILNEYALKLKVGMPTYNTRNIEEHRHQFVSSVVVNGTNYSGDVASSKKNAEQLAARAAIISNLGGSTSRILYEIVNSKLKNFGAVQPDTSQCVEASTSPNLANTTDNSLSLDCWDKEIVGGVHQVASGSEINVEEAGLEPRCTFFEFL